MKKEHVQVGIQFIKFGVVGALNTIISMSIYYLGIYLQIYYLISNFLAFIISVFISYLLNGRFVFGNREKEDFWKGLLKVYTSYALTGLLLSSILLSVQVEILHISQLIAPVLNLVFTVPINFVLNKYWVYGKRKRKGETR
ncbi:MAG: GtrA family protein [Eubacteriales bacterium]